MSPDKYAQLVDHLPLGYAYHKILCDESGKPCDYSFIEVNHAFELLTGLKGSDIVGRRITEVMPGIGDSEFNWIEFYGAVALTGEKQEFEQYSASLNRWYRVNAYSPEKEYFITIVAGVTKERSEIIDLHRLSVMSEEFLQRFGEATDYQKITDHFLEITDAKLAALNLYDEDGKQYTTMAVAGDRGNIDKGMKIIGMKLVGKKWTHDSVRDAKIKDRIVTRFPTLHDLSGDVIPKLVCNLLTKSFGLGETVVVKIAKDNIMLGDFTLIMPKGKSFDKDSIAEIFTRQLGLALDRAWSEKALRESEARYRSLFEVANVGKSVTLPTGEIEVNQAFCDMLGYTPEELRGKTWQELTPSEEIGPINERLAPLLRGEKNAIRFEKRYIHKNNSYVWADVSATTLADIDGNLLAFIVTVVDITERKRAELSLQQSEKKHRVLFEHSVMGIYLHDTEGRIIDVNNAACLQLKYTKDELLNLNVLDLHSDEAGTVNLPKDEILRQWNDWQLGHQLVFEDEHRCKDGTIIPVQISAGPVEYEQGKRILAMVQDITERKKTEFELRQSEERFQILFNQAPLGYQSLDSEGHFIEVNQQWLDFLGYSREEVIGNWFGNFLCPEYVDGFRQRFPVFKSQGYITSEFEMLSKNGQRLAILFEGKIGYGADGEFKQTHCILKDITDQRRAENALKESEQRYRGLFESAGVGIGYYSTDGVVMSFNRKALEDLGGKLADYVGKSIRDVFPEDEAEIYLARIETATLCEQPQEYEDHVVLNSKPIWFASTYTRVTSLSGVVLGVQVAALDITEQKQLEHDLRRSAEHLQRTLDNMQDAYLQTDVSGNYVIVNPAAERTFGYDRGEMLGMSASKIYATQGARDKILEEIRSQGWARDFHTRGLRKDGSEFWASMSAHTVRNELGEAIGTEGTVRDVTERVVMTEELEQQRDMLIKRLDQMIQTISRIAELRDPYTAGHQTRVADLACKMAAELGLSRQAVENIRLAAPIHDIGKIFIPSDILNKPGPISTLEYQMIQTHAEQGYNVVKGIDMPVDIATMIYQHHERLDGSGYPQGLSGDKIILESRIMAVADVVEAMSSHRPYRAALGIDTALEEILLHRGTKYDAEVVDVCVKLFKEDGYALQSS